MKFQSKRFLKLIESVKAQPSKLFNMRHWAVKLDCGTAGCAVGSYCLAHPRADLRIVFYGDSVYGDAAQVEIRNDRCRLLGFPAVAEHFGITEGEARNLFEPRSVLAPGKPNAQSVVLKRLNAFYRERMKGAAA